MSLLPGALFPGERMWRSQFTLACCAFCLIISRPARAGSAAKAAPESAVQVVNDLAYRTDKDADPQKHKLDLYLPKGRKNFPVLFFVHGGAWKSGDRKIYPFFGRLFARHGIGTVIISYRLSPTVQHPAHVQDVAKAFAWTHANIARYGGRPDQIFICGHSAGGHLVALLATDESYLKAEKLSPANIKGVIAISGLYTITPVADTIREAFGSDAEVCKQASPTQHVTGNAPPFSILYADNDMRFLDKSAERMYALLQKAKDDVRIQKIDKRTHITIISQLDKGSDPTANAILEFIKKHTTAPGA
jgi:acetyl esterase/lipase